MIKTNLMHPNKFESPDRPQVCLAIVDTAFANPVPPVGAGVPEEVRDASRVACNASVVHQADRMLRDLVGKRMREFRETSAGPGEAAGEAASDKATSKVCVVVVPHLTNVNDCA